MFKQIILSLAVLTAAMPVGAECVTWGGYDYELGPSTILLSHDAMPSEYTYNDAVKAIEAINGSGVSNVTLLVAPSVYWLDNPDDPAIRRNPTNSGSVPYAVEVSCDTLSIIGLADNPEDVVFAVNRGQTQGALGNYTMMHFAGKSLRVENMTMGNYCNVDLEYPRNPSLSRARRRDAIVQAQVGICSDTDRLYARNCRFISRLNLCPLVGARRTLYENCYFECTDDALSGSAVYLGCRFTFHSGKPFYSTAATGAVFLDCDIHTLVSGTQYLTKMPGMVTMIDTRFTSEHPVTLKWTRDASPVRCYQSDVTLNGEPVIIDADRRELSSIITDSPLLDAYKVYYDDATIYNTPNLLGGNDGWDPTGLRDKVQRIARETSTQLLGLPVLLRLTPSTRELAPEGDTLTVNTSLRLWGDYEADVRPGTLTWSAPSTLTLLSATDRLTALSANTYPKEMACLVSATSPSGLAGATSVDIAPYLREAPGFVTSPAISSVKSTLQLDYTLPADGEDDSYIIWYRSTQPDMSDSIAVRHGRGLSARTYPLSPADKNYYLSATVMPKLDDTRAGKPVTIRFEKPVSSGMIGLLQLRERELKTSFAEIPIRRGEAGKPGFWNFDTYKPADTATHDWVADADRSWYYGRGADAATGMGLVQAVRGARLSYTPSRGDCRSMSVNIIAEPAKGPGQGFGSATGQYMDICVKFDPVTLTGYALRIERTPDYDKAVTMTLVKYTDGRVTPISEPVPTSCYRTPCHISLDINDNKLTVTAKTDAPAVTPSSADIKPYVMLTAPVEQSRNSSLMIQHTGSTGASATLLRDLNISWK